MPGRWCSGLEPSPVRSFARWQPGKELIMGGRWIKIAVSQLAIAGIGVAGLMNSYAQADDLPPWSPPKQLKSSIKKL